MSRKAALYRKVGKISKNHMINLRFRLGRGKRRSSVVSPHRCGRSRSGSGYAPPLFVCGPAIGRKRAEPGDRAGWIRENGWPGNSLYGEASVAADTRERDRLRLINSRSFSLAASGTARTMSV